MFVPHIALCYPHTLQHFHAFVCTLVIRTFCYRLSVSSCNWWFNVQYKPYSLLSLCSHTNCCNNCVCMLHVTFCMSTCVTRLFSLFCLYPWTYSNWFSLWINLVHVVHHLTPFFCLYELLSLSVLSPLILHVKPLTRFHVSCTASGALCPCFCCIRCHLSFCSYFVYSPFFIAIQVEPHTNHDVTVTNHRLVTDGKRMDLHVLEEQVSINTLLVWDYLLIFPCLCYSYFHFNFVNDVVHVACTYFYTLINVYVYICDAGMHVDVRLHEGVWGQRLVGVMLLFILFICCLISFFLLLF